MDALEVELRKIQPQPDQAAVGLRDIPPNPNPGEVEEIPDQPQPDTIGHVEDDGGDRRR